MSSRRSPDQRTFPALCLLVCALGVILSAQPAYAALTISKTTWNVIGLDSNDVNTGPNVFPVAVTVCNTGPTDATNVTTTFSWDSSNSLINLTGPAVVNYGTLAAGACLRVYYWVAVTRTSAAYLTTRRYHITATADGGLGASTPVRELYVERLVSQNRNSSQTPSGPTTVVVGQTYTYNWVGSTATQGYEQIENFLSLNESIFRVLSVQSTYSAGSSPIAGMYNDACGWNDDPASGGYRTCSGSAKAGGSVTMSVTVLIIGTGSTSIAGAIYDFSGSSYHYNSDFGNNALRVTAVPPAAPPTPVADLSVTKTDGVSDVNAGGTVTYTIVIRNAGPSAADGAVVSDPAVAGLAKTAVTCSAAAGAACPASVTVSGLESGLVIPTLPSGGTITLTVTALVTAGTGSLTNTVSVAPPPGTIDSNSANNTASDTDTVAAAAAQADLAATKTDGVATVNPGATTTYTIVVTNTGPASVTGATVTDAAPAGLTFGAWTCSGSGGATCPASGSGNVTAVVNIPVGGSVTFHINATVAADASGSLTNTVTVTLPIGTADSNPGNNTATDTDTVLAQRIGVAKSAGTPLLIGGSTFEIPYTIVVSNIGPVPATNVQVTDDLNDTFKAGSPVVSLATAAAATPIGGASAAQCEVNRSFTGTGSSTSLLTGATTLAPGQGCTITFRVRVAYPNVASIPGGPQLNAAVAATYASPGGARIARDVSDSGSDPAGSNPGAPGDTGGADDPTPVVLRAPSDAEPEATLTLPVLSLTKQASTAISELGDSVTYSIQVRNTGGPTLPAMTIEDRLPLGFSYIAGTAQLTVGTTVLRLADPQGAQTRFLIFAIPTQVSANDVTLTYQVRVSVGAQQGDGTNHALAIAADGRRSNEGTARVLVSSGVFTQQACIIGKVFDDASANAVQDRGERGVAGVTLYLEDGTSVRTDGAGAFSYCGLRAGTHVLKVDPMTLPAGTMLVRSSNRNALDAGSAFIDVKFGEVHRVDFVVAQTVGLPDMRTPGRNAPLLAVGILEGSVSFSSLDFSASQAARPRDVFDEELRRFSRSINGGKEIAAARAAMFLNGPVGRNYRVSVSFDSERSNRGVLFRDIQPDAFYPIYGDASEKRFDAQTSGRMYAKAERGRSYLLYGDLVTMARDTPARDLGTYARTLTGVQHRLDTRKAVVNLFATRDTLRQVVDEWGGRGISGPYSVSNPNGVSGSEKVEIVTRDRNQPAVILSTQPLTRFLDYEFEPFSGRVVFRRPVPSLDEHLNPVSIRITYEIDNGGSRHWVEGFDAQVRLAPRLQAGGSWAKDHSAVAPYDLGSANVTARLTAHTTLIAEAARSSGTVNTNPFNVSSWSNFAGVSGDTSGHAARVELAHDASGLEARAFAGTSDATFDNPAATLNGGRTEAGVRAAYKFTSSSRLHGELIRSGDRLTGGVRQGGVVAVESKFKRAVFELGLRHVSETATPAQGSAAGLIQPFGTGMASGFGFAPIGSEIDPVTGLPIVRPGASPQLSAGTFAPHLSPIDTTTLRARVSSAFGKANAYVEGEQDVGGADKHMAAAGGEYRAADHARLYVRHELISGLDGLYGLREGQRSQRTVLGVSSAYPSAGELFSEYRMNEAISGREAQAAIGLRNAWTIREGLRVSTGLERLEPMRSAGEQATAATFGAEYTRSADFKGTSRFEWRREGPRDSWFSTAGAAKRLTANWTMLAKNYYQLANTARLVNQLQDRFWIGTAYRDGERNRQNLLSRYEFKLERNPIVGLTQASGDRSIHVVSTHGDYRRSQPWMTSWQYAGKWVRETLADASQRYSAHLVAGRAGYDLTRRVDLGALASVMWSGSDDRLRKALGAEVGLLLRENTWLSLGYNVTGFSDRDFNDVLSTDSTTRGFFIRLRFKFDEELLRRH